MKKKLSLPLRIAAFALLFAWLFVHISYAKRPDLSGVRDSISGFYATERESLDVIVVGASGCMSAFMPMKAYEDYGLASYDFCLDDLACETVSFVLREAEKTQSPKLYLIDIRPFVTGASLAGYVERDEVKDIAYNTDGFRYSADRFRFLWKNLPHTVSSLSYCFDLSRYHKEELNLKNWNGSYHNLRRGFDFYPWGSGITFDEETDERTPIDPVTERELRALLETCRELDGEVLFFFLPYAHYDRCPDLLTNRNYIADLLADEGFGFLDLSSYYEEMQLSAEEDYCNDAHWNVFGAEKITAKLTELVKERYELPDHRGEAAYRSWEEDLPAWQEAVAEEQEAVKKQR